MNKWLLSVLCFVSSLSLFGQGPNDGFIMEAEAVSHLLAHSDPVYPPIAKAAHVQGDVLLHVSVSETGAVIAIDVVGGPAMLKGAAIEAVKHWTYTPFEVNGMAAPVKVVVSVPFSLGIPSVTEKSDQAIGQAFFPKETECRNFNSSHNWTKAQEPCAQLVAIGDRFPDLKLRSNEIRTAHEAYGESLIYSGDAKSALVEFQKAIDVAEKSLTSVDEEYAAAYYWRAFAEHALKMPAEAERDYSTAESSFRKAMTNLPDMKAIYGRSLAHTLAFHSVLAQQTGRPGEAAKMQAEALQLDPHSMDGIGAK